MISVDEALALIDQHRPDWGVEDVAIEAANGKILARDVISDLNYPSHDVSIMDGYALRKSDLQNTLRVVGESRAGQPYGQSIAPREAIRIFTGANLPEGADYVEIQENAIRDGSNLTFPKVSRGRHYIRDAGTGFAAGDILFKKGTRITPAVILVLATANISHVSVRKLPRIALLRSGDELRPLGSSLNAGEIIDSNGPGLMALLSGWGVPVSDLGAVEDNPAAIHERVRGCDADIIVPVGGASVGDYDFMKSVFSEAGFRPIFDKVAVKPGKPVWFSKADEKIVFGLPGNPYSAWLCCHLFLRYLLGFDLNWTHRPLAKPVEENGIRENYLRARIESDGRVSPIDLKDYGPVLSIAHMQTYIRRMPLDDERGDGTLVSCLQIDAQ